MHPVIFRPFHIPSATQVGGKRFQLQRFTSAEERNPTRHAWQAEAPDLRRDYGVTGQPRLTTYLGGSHEVSRRNVGPPLGDPGLGARYIVRRGGEVGSVAETSVAWGRPAGRG